MSKIHLPRELEKFAEDLVVAGRYVDVSHAVAAGLELLRDVELIRETRRAELFAKIDEGLADVDAGRTVPAEEVFAEMRAMLAEHRVRDAAE